MKWMKFTCVCLVVSLAVSAWPQSAVLTEDHAVKVRMEVQKRATGELSRVRVWLRDKPR